MRRFLKDTKPSEVKASSFAAFAGTDPALIRYYFGSMRELLTVVATVVARETHEQMASEVAAASSSREKLVRRTRVFLAMHEQNPYMNELVVDYIVNAKGRDARRAREEMVAESVSTLAAILKEGERDGEFRRLDARFLHIALTGMFGFFFSGRPVVETIFGNEAFTPELIAAYGIFLNDLLMNGLRKDQADSDARAIRKGARSVRRRRKHGDAE